MKRIYEVGEYNPINGQMKWIDTFPKMCLHGQRAHEKMLSITDQEKIQNHSEILLHTC